MSAVMSYEFFVIAERLSTLFPRFCVLTDTGSPLDIFYMGLNFLAHLCTLQRGLICVTFCASVCLSVWPDLTKNQTGHTSNQKVAPMYQKKCISWKVLQLGLCLLCQ